MKFLILIFSLLLFTPNFLSQFGADKWGYGEPTVPLKKIDINNSFLINSNSNFFQFDAILYPVSLFFNDRMEIFDLGLGGGISRLNKSKLDPCAKLLINKDWHTNWQKRSRWGNDLIANYLFQSKQMNIGLNLSYSKGYNEYIYFKLKAGPSYLTGTKELLFSTTLSIGIENLLATRQVKKPVVYFYPTDTMSLEVSLKFNGDVSFCYPAFKEKWNFQLYPNSIFVDLSTKTKYPYLFWEGEYDLSQLKKKEEGFIVKKAELIAFFEEKLPIIGLNRREITDFITFWVPTLCEENYHIQFITQEECNDIAHYQFSENPDAFIRVIALFKRVELNTMEIMPQVLKPIIRKGFTIVEWGGIELPFKEL